MPNRHSVRFLLFLFLLIPGLVLVGCSDDDETTADITDPIILGGDGDIFVNTGPSLVDIPWTLSFPGGQTFAGENSHRFRNQDQGIYTLSWPELVGWNEPRPSTVEQTLDGGSNLVFTAIYLPRPGTTLVKVIPEGLDAAWKLENPDGLLITSSGDTTLTSLAPGYYRTIWYDVEGFDTPDTAISILGIREPMEVVGSYGYPDSTLLVNITPPDLDAPWTLTDLDSFSVSGSGQTKVDIPNNGHYTLTWLDVEGRITPEPETLFIHLEDEALFYISGDYQPVSGTVNLSATINGINMPWNLTNSSGGIQQGVGDAQLTGMRPGPCSIEWMPLDGWAPSGSEDLDLPSGGSISFTASPEAAITVRPLPMDLYASWQLSGPGGYLLDGSGEMLIDGLSAGSYTITWATAAGWGEPATSSQSLSTDNGLVFEGLYAQTAQTLHVNPLPASLDIPWEISGPLGFSESGTGMASFPLSENGHYTVVWGSEPGFMQPAPDMLEYSGEGNLNFQADYQETLDLVSIVADDFNQGSSNAEGCRSILEERHEVTLTRDFIMKATEVTNNEYIAMAQWAYDRGYITADRYGINDNLDGSTVELLDLDDGDQEIFFEDGVFRCIRPNHPVKEVSWYGAVSYCDWLSLYRGFERSYDHYTWLCGTTHPTQAFGFRLPTESEWEFACRAGSTNAYANGGISMGPFGCYSNVLEDIGWYDLNGGGWSNEVGQLEDNGWGLYDMHGNVREWCNDLYQDIYYTETILHGPLVDPPGSLEGVGRTVRGGYFFSSAASCRSAARASLDPANASYDTGFRVVLTGN